VTKNALCVVFRGAESAGSIDAQNNVLQFLKEKRTIFEMRRRVITSVKRLKRMQKVFKDMDKYRQAIKQSYKEIFDSEIKTLEAQQLSSPSKKKGKKTAKESTSKYTRVH
jgi:hypothetical protein